ncbi:MAG: helix-turn-helix transcriptional regulator [Actinobacteria bacterium]|nr:MAG: helix-turn-helix transcriptional regulator [Actinomycetota bacterium]
MWRCRSCPPVPEDVRHAADVLERRGSMAIVYACHTGATRFNEFARAVGGLAPQTLANRLVQLEDAGLIGRVVLASRPPRAEYRLTQSGRRLAEVLEGALPLVAHAGSARTKPGRLT